MGCADTPLSAQQRANENTGKRAGGTTGVDRSGSCLPNKLGGNALSTMPKTKPTIGPMRTQPAERASTMTTPMQAAVGKVAKVQQPKQGPATTEASRAEKARITRLNSLRKQRRALKPTSGN